MSPTARSPSAAATPRAIASFVAALGAGVPAETLLAMFAESLAFEIPGDPKAFPWMGRSTGRAGVAHLLDGLRRLLVLEGFVVNDILAGERRAVVLGDLASRVVATGKLIETPFAIVLTIADGKIAEFLMLEDSFAVSGATRP